MALLFGNTHTESDMANRLNAGEKIHLAHYRARNVDGKVKLRRVKMMIGDRKVDSNLTMCGTTHSADDIDWFLEKRKSHPESVCKRCEKKLKKIVNEAA
jgi:hypothetical protein